MSCCSTPCKIIECVLERSMHAVRILRCQNPLPPGLERLRRRAAALRRDFQRPAEMLARVLEPDTQPVMAAHFIVEGADMAKLFGQRRRGLGLATFKPAADLSGQPGLSLRTAADHDRIGARHLEGADRLLERGD